MTADRRNTTRVWASSASCALLASLLSMAAWSTCLNPLPPPDVPVFHSNPGALRIVYLDFDGYCEGNYVVRGLPAETWPPFDARQDRDAIRDIWERVAEDMAPFDVDVTTQYPSNLGEHFFWDSDAGARTSGIRVVITGADLLPGHGKSPEHPLPYNVVYVDQFTAQSGVLQRRSNRAIAQTVSHELGHTFSFYLSDVTGASLGLSHYTLPQHNLIAQHKTPILGASVDERDIWWKDPMVAVVGENGAMVYRPQEDMMVLWAATGFRADDHRDEAGLATPLVGSGGATRLEGRGIITMNAASFPSSCAIWGDPAHPMCHVWRQAHGPQPGLLEDKDFFRFRTANAGTFDVMALTINNPGADFTRANLDAEIELWRKPAGGAWTPSTAFNRLSLPDDLSVGISVTESSASGAEYAVAIKSAGEYGDLGQYSVTASGPIVREAIQNIRLDDPEVPAYDEAKVQFDETDSAWYRISPSEPGTLTITAEGFDAYDGGYAELALYDSSMRSVAIKKGADAPINQPVAKGETYLLRVSGSKTSGRVTFQLT